TIGAVRGRLVLQANGYAKGNLESRGGFANARGSSPGSIHADFFCANDEGTEAPGARARPPFTKPALAVPARLHQESSDGGFDHPVEPGPHRQDAGSGG